LIHLIGEGLGKPARLFPVPMVLLKFMALAAGKAAEFESLCGNLQVDAGKANRMLGWQARVPIGQGVSVAARSFVA
jgi:hypothetical protein